MHILIIIDDDLYCHPELACPSEAHKRRRDSACLPAGRDLSREAETSSA